MYGGSGTNASVYVHGTGGEVNVRWYLQEMNVCAKMTVDDGGVV